MLFVSVVILTVIFWEPFSQLLTEGSFAGEFGIEQLISRVVVFACMMLLASVFYLPVRLLFLVEDGHYPATWLQISVVLSPLVWHIVAG